ncbi:MAG: TIR domain-containing protein [Rhodomicrobium sp.]
MADIFISYAKAAPEPTRSLAAELAALKYSFWFDERLLPIDASFGLVINDQIDSAKAVITIWSQPALKSEWVYAEALKGKKKLLNLHTPDVNPDHIPAPFNAGHIVPASERTKVYEALAKLGVHPGGVAPVEKAAREASDAALAFEHIKNSTDIEDFEQFLIDFADGKQFYIRLARKKIAELTARRGGIVVAKPAEAPLPQAGDVFLRIEPGMHTAPIKRIGVDAAGTLMVTGSEDKMARLWALPEGGRGAPALLRTLRMPIGEGNDGKVYATALSPDGKWVAAGGWDASWSIDKTMSVYIFEAATGRLATRLGRLGSAIPHLAFSPDGRRLAATLGGGEGLRLWETGSWRPLAEDKDYGGKQSYGAAFGGNGALYTVAYDGAIRRYGAGGGLEAKATTQGGTRPFSIAVHPDGTKLAVGFTDVTAVEVYDSRTLKRLYAADTSGISGGDLGGVAWSADGARLYAGGRHQSSDGGLPLLIWQDAGRGRRSEAPLSQNAIVQLLPCGDGIAAGAQDPAFGLVAADGTKRVWQEGVTADMRGKLRDAFTLSADGARVRFGLGVGAASPVLFDLAAFELRDAPQAVSGLTAPKTSGIVVSDWENNTAPKLNGKPIALEAYETSRALAVAPDASRFALGAEYRLRAYRADGSELWNKAIPGIAYGVNISGNGKLVVAAYYDGTIRWHRLSDGQELLALFVHAKDRRFIAWTPQGYYAASPGGEDLIGWHVNRGFDTAPDFYPASTFASTFRRPDIVRAALGDLDAPAPKAEGFIDRVRKLF